MSATTLIVAALTALAAVPRFVGIGHQSFWYDETFTVLLVHHSPGRMLGLLPQTELTPPLYYLAAWVWARIFGYSELGLRSLSALAGVATVPAVYGAAAVLTTRRAGLAAAALAACNPLLIWYSQEARSYSLLVLLAALSLLAMARIRLLGPMPRRLVAWALAASLTLATHYYGAVAVVPQAIWLLWVHRRSWRVWLTVAVVAVVGGGLLPIALTQQPHASWIAAWPLGGRLNQITPQLVLGTGASARTWLKLAGALALLTAFGMLATRADGVERRGALLAAALAIVGFLLALALIPAGVDELITRNVIDVLVPLIVLVAGGLGARRAGWLGLTGVCVLCAIGLAAATAVAAEWRLQRPDWRGLALTLRSDGHSAAGRAVVVENYPLLTPLGIYMPGLRWMSSRGARVGEVDIVAIRGPGRGWFCWWGSACNLPSSTLPTVVRLRAFHSAGRVLHVGQFSVLRLRTAGARPLLPGQVARGLAKMALPEGYALLVQAPT